MERTYAGSGQIKKREVKIRRQCILYFGIIWDKKNVSKMSKMGEIMQEDEQLTKCMQEINCKKNEQNEEKKFCFNLNKWTIESGFIKTANLCHRKDNAGIFFKTNVATWIIYF